MNFLKIPRMHGFQKFLQKKNKLRFQLNFSLFVKYVYIRTYQLFFKKLDSYNGWCSPPPTCTPRCWTKPIELILWCTNGSQCAILKSTDFKKAAWSPAFGEEAHQIPVIVSLPIHPQGFLAAVSWSCDEVHIDPGSSLFAACLSWTVSPGCFLIRPWLSVCPISGALAGAQTWS